MHVPLSLGDNVTLKLKLCYVAPKTLELNIYSSVFDATTHELFVCDYVIEVDYNNT